MLLRQGVGKMHLMARGPFTTTFQNPFTPVPKGSRDRDPCLAAGRADQERVWVRCVVVGGGGHVLPKKTVPQACGSLN